jgi:hypothetical protein
LQVALDLLHRRIEEWTEAALLEPDVSNSSAEGFREYGADLVAFLIDIVETWEVGDEDLMLDGADATGREVCEEVVRAIVEQWEEADFGERPADLEIDELRTILEAISEVLESSVEDADDEMDQALELLEPFLAEVW